MRKPSVPRVFIDANILFSAALSGDGRSAALFLLAERGCCRLVSSHYAIEEARRNLAGKNPVALKSLPSLLSHVHVCEDADEVRLKMAAATRLDPGDVPILGAAYGNADFLVTGDRKHFGFLMGEPLHGLRVIGLAELLDMLLPE
jgi:predicted nucleic acid-binding protein